MYRSQDDVAFLVPETIIRNAIDAEVIRAAQYEHDLMDELDAEAEFAADDFELEFDWRQP